MPAYIQSNHHVQLGVAQKGPVWFSHVFQAMLTPVYPTAAGESMREDQYSKYDDRRNTTDSQLGLCLEIKGGRVIYIKLSW